MKKILYRSLSLLLGAAALLLFAFVVGAVIGAQGGLMAYDYFFSIAIWILLLGWGAMLAQLSFDRSMIDEHRSDWRLMMRLVGPLAPIGFFWWIADDYESLRK